MATNSWTFKQLTKDNRGGPAKTFVLNGYAAPFGRPRKEPVAKELIKVRISTTYYPGSSGPPTRHSFGSHYEPMELKGRWMTKTGIQHPDSNDQAISGTGVATANSVASDWTEFVRDERQVRITWGAIASWVGFIEELELSRESENEIAWRMRILVDKREDEEARATIQTTQQAKYGIDPNELLADQFFTSKLAIMPPNVDDYSVDFLSQIDGFASSMNQFAATGNNLVEQVGDITKAVSSIQRHFLGAIEGILTDLDELRDLILNASIDQVLIADSWVNQAKHMEYIASFDDQSAIVLEQLALTKREVELNAQPEFSAVVVAKAGDTWESLSIRATGTAAKAAEMRRTADTDSFTPTTGEVYFVPTS